MLLDSIHSPSELKKLGVDGLAQVAAETRRKIIETVSVCGGHLASSLGAVEVIIALHYCLNAPKDKIIFDVGHQAYAHKILTGRGGDFCRLRACGGISGFPCQDESEYDPFTTGHSSTAVSQALGLACAQDFLNPRQRARVVAVIGDGSLSGGLCFEGLNNAGHMKKDMLVVLNTNELSIAPNVGALSTYLNKIISLPIYNRFKESLERFAASRLPKGNRLIMLANKFEEGLKHLFVPGMLFEELGFRYFGPFDGHDLGLLVKTLKNILPIKGPLLLHVVTKKGKGYLPAEKNPVRFHGVGPFEIAGGAPVVNSGGTAMPTYTEIFSEKLVALAQADTHIVAVTAAMPEGTGLDRFRDSYPGRFFDVGIAEGHAVCFAGGLAKGGVRPVVAIYSTFLQRAYDQIIEDVALQRRPVVLAVDRAGIVGEDGVTHQGIFDIAYLRSVPHLIVMAPRDAPELEEMLAFAVQAGGPVALRYPRGEAPVLPLPCAPIERGKAHTLAEGGDFLLVALGSMVGPAWSAVKMLESDGIKGGLINARFVKPLDMQLFKRAARNTPYIFTVEEGILDGGFGSAVGEVLDMPVHRIGLPCAFIPHGTRQELLARYGLTAQGIAGRIRAARENNKKPAIHNRHG